MEIQVLANDMKIQVLANNMEIQVLANDIEIHILFFYLFNGNCLDEILCK